MKQMKRALSLLLCLAMLAAYVPVPAFAETEGEPEHQHSWDQGVVTAPGCESAGFTTYTCADCGNTKQEDEVAALGHSWGEWMVTQEPTELAEGSRERTCGSCSKKETGAIDKLTPVPSVVAAASVTVTQAQNYTEVIVTDTLQLTALVLPEDTTDKTVIWTSSDESIATVDAAGLVTGEALGDVIITAACGEVTGSYALTVVMPEHSVLAAYAGACGDGLKWRLDTYTGKMTITGTGAMYDYANSADAHAPWYSYADTIKTVEIASGATSIGNYAFHNCSKMTSITIPDTVTSFGIAAFQGCGKLESISIPYGVNSIGEYAFNACYLIEKFLVDANNRYYSSDNTGALYNKDKTVLIKAPAGIYGPYTIPDGVITIGFNAFGATNSMMSVTIPDSVTTIGDQAFFACQLLKSVEIPANVTSIGKEAFLSCTDLKSITLSSGVTSIGDFAFHSCENLTDIYYYGTEAQWEVVSIGNYNAPLLSATIHYADPCADGHAFDANHKCTDCGYIGGTCGTGLTWNFDESTGTLTISGNGDMVDYGKRNVSGSADEPDTAKIPWYGIRSQIKSVVTEFGVSHLGNFAFYDCSAMESITITTSVSSIGYGMVQQCRLKDVYYTATEAKWDNLTIGSGQSGFSSAVMHFNVTDPANHWSPERVEATCTENGYKQDKCACGHTRNYQILPSSGSHNYGSGAKCTVCGHIGGTCGDNLEWTFDAATGKLTISGSNAMEDYSSWSETPWYAYQDQIKTVTIQNGVTAIGEKAFAYLGNLTKVEIANSVTSIGTQSFAYCGKLENITIPDSVTSIGNKAFADDNKLTSVVIPDSVKTIGPYAFWTCDGLTSVTIPSSVSSIGLYAFYSCTKLEGIWVDENNTKYSSDSRGVLFNKAKTELIQAPGGISGSYTVPDSVSIIDQKSFDSCGKLTAVIIPEGVAAIAADTFSFCDGLTSVTIPKSVTAIGDAAFCQCSNLKDVYYNGTEAQWKAVSIGSANDPLLAATVHYPDPCADGHTFDTKHKCTDCGYIGGTCGTGLTWNFDESTGTLTISGTGAMYDYIDDTPWTSYISEIKTVEIGSGVTSIGYSAFFDCSSLENVQIPASVKSIGGYAFGNCVKLSQINIPDGVTGIAEGAFCGCSNLKSVKIPSGVTEIQKYAFYKCSGLGNVGIPSSVTQIGGDAFFGCSNLWHVSYTGTKEQWNAVEFTYGNERLEDVCLHINWRDDVTLDLENKKCPTCVIAIKIKMYDVGKNGWSGNEIEVWVDNVLTDTVTLSSGGYGTWTMEYDETKSYRFVWRKADNHYSHEQCGCDILLGHKVVFSKDYSYFTNCYDLTTLYSICNHNWQSATCTQPQTCSRCGEKQGTALRHSYTRNVADQEFLKTAATCKDKAVYYKSCICGAKGAETFEYGTVGDHTRDVNHKCSHCGHIGGTCGDNLEWTFDSATGKLTIFGTGAMNNYVNNAPWISYRNDIKSVEIASGVTTIGNYAFGGCANMESVSIPNTVTSIGNSAFESGNKLTSIEIPASVTNIGSSAFRWHSGLTDVVIPSSVTTIGEQAFNGCTNLVSVVIPSGVTSMGADALSGCYDLTDVYFGGTRDNWNRFDVTYSNEKAVTHFGVTNPTGHWVENNKDATCTESGHTGKKCACGYTRTETTIPAGHSGKVAVCPICKAYGYCGDDLIWALDDAGTLSITGTGDMYHYTERSGAPWYAKCNQIKKVIIGTGAASIGNYAFYDCRDLEEITIPEGVTSIGGFALKDCVSLKNITLPESLKTIGGSAFSNCKVMESIALPKGLTAIGGGAFEYCNELKQIQIPSGITAIESETFRYCVKLESVTLPRNLTSIGNYAFANCIFTEIEIPGKVTSIGDRAFSAINTKSKLSKITFVGDCPTFSPGNEAKNVFLGVTATAYYPAGNETWTEDVRQGYGGELTWVARQLDPESYGVKIGGIAVTDDNLSGEYWRYDPDDNILHLSDGFNKAISATRHNLIIEISGTTSADDIRTTGTNVTLRAKTNSPVKPMMNVTWRGIDVKGGNLTVENIKLTVTSCYIDGISVTEENGEGGKLIVNNAWLSASAKGNEVMHGIEVEYLTVNGSSYVYGSTSRAAVDAIYINQAGRFSSACHVEASANNGYGIMGYGMTFPDYAYIRNTYPVDGSTEFEKVATATAYPSGRIQTYRSYEFIGLDHTAYANKGETHSLVCKCTSPTTVDPSEAHTWSYSLNGTDAIDAECSVCRATGSVKLVPPQNLVSDGTNAREAALEGSIPGVTPVITYEGTNLVEGKPVKAGTYTAKTTLENTTAELRFTLTAEPVAAVTVGSTTTPYTSLTDAIAAASAAEGSTLKLLQDITLETTQDMPVITSGDFTLDLNDKTLKSLYTDALRVNGGTLLITDTGLDPDKGALVTESGQGCGVSIYNGAAVTLSGISVHASSLSVHRGVYMKDGNLTITACTIAAPGNYGVSVDSGTLSVTCSTISGKYALSFRGSTAQITDSTVTGSVVGVYVNGGADALLSGNTITGQTGMIVYDADTEVTVTGGTLSGVGYAFDGGNAAGLKVLEGTVDVSNADISAEALSSGSGWGVYVEDGTINFVDGTVSSTAVSAGKSWGVYVESGTANITGGSISGSGADLMIDADSDGTIHLGLPADGDVGTSFPGGILVEGTTLKDILGSGASYWVGTQEQSLAADATEIAGDVTVRKHTQHSYNGFAADKTTGETHTRVCIFCGEALTENHAYTETVAEADYLKSEATCTESAVYYKSCQCGATGTETFTNGKPLDHTFDQEVAEEKYLKSEATCTEPAVYYRSCKCGETGTETFTGGKPLDHTFDQEVAEEKYLKSEATCTESAVYYRSCKCGETGADTFTYGKPLDHTFDQEVAEEKYLKSEATHTSAAVYYKSCKCGEIGSDTFAYGEPLTGSIVRIPTADLEGSTSVWIDGVQYPVVTDGEMSYVTLPNESVTLMITYTYHVGDANDVHTQYPTGMKVWQVTRSDAGFTAKHLGALDNILQYKGSSIRITGNKGIRMITAVPTSKKAALTGAGLEGYKLLEYGTVLSWASALADGSPLVLGPDYAKYNYAYKRDVADPVFAYTGDTVQYTNVLVGFTNDQCKDDIAMRSYMILEDAQGNQVTLYGGIVYRSIGYIAYQNRAAFGVGSAAYEYVWEIIHHVYGDQYDSEYRG